MLPKKAVFGVHQEGAAVGARDRSESCRRAAAHSGGGGGPGFLLATTSEVSTLSERLRQRAARDFDSRSGFTNKLYFAHPRHCNAKGATIAYNCRPAGFAQIDPGAEQCPPIQTCHQQRGAPRKDALRPAWTSRTEPSWFDLEEGAPNGKDEIRP